MVSPVLKINNSEKDVFKNFHALNQIGLKWDSIVSLQQQYV